MGKSSSQVVGYRYYAKFAAFIGNRIEKLIGINFDNRKWVIHDPLKHPPNLLPVLEGNLFGENEGGVSGNVDIHFGYPDPEPNAEYQKYFPLVSGYPYQSYLVFRSLTGGAPSLGEGLSPAGFYLGNSGYMKEMLLWVKRIHVKNNGDVQWYDEKSEIGQTIKYGKDEEFAPSGSFVVPSSFSIPMNYYSKSHFSEGSGSHVGSGTYNANTNEITGSIDLLVGGAASGVFDPEQYCEARYDVQIPDIAAYLTLVAEFELRKPDDQVNVICSSLINYDIVQMDNPETLGHRYRLTAVVAAPTNFTLQLISKVSRGVMGCFISFLRFDLVSDKIRETEGPDINPIHKIREILTDDAAMGKPESDVNDVNFVKAADRIWDEGLGISWAIDEKSCIEAIEELCYHIEAGIRVNRQTGLYEMVLFRDDWFAEDEIHSVAENKIKDLSLEVMNSDDIVNQLNVTYYDRERIKNSTFSVYENGSILTMGKVNAESIDFPYFMNMRNAEIVANWKLKQFSTPAWSGSFTTGWKEARKWNRYDLIRLPWSKKWDGTILVRIMKINLGNGTDNTVTIDFEEVIPYSGEMNTSIVVDAPVDAGPQPPQPNINSVFEAPYYLTVLRAGQTNADLELSNNPDIGYVAAIAAKPQNNSLNALLFTDGGVGEFEQVSRLDYCDILQLDQPINETASAFVVTGSLTQTANSNNLILLNGELMGFVAFDDATKVLTVKRGVLDTIPKKHNSGNLFVFDLPDVAFDSTQYAQSEIVEAQVLTTTPSGIQELLTTGTAVEIQARAIRPYPPANVKINNEYYPSLVRENINLSWVDRNRLQQTGGEILGFYDSGVTKEGGVVYVVNLYNSLNELLVTKATELNSVIIGQDEFTASNARLEIISIRDGYECFQKFVHEFTVESAVNQLKFTTPYTRPIGNNVVLKFEEK
ncbi:hypothetical protein [Acinetobacter lwoffii]|uniref:hypothetical protein n=1 Tax=Acinetobacter lwoffii TaxID=28090 RepID=UPI003081DABB